MKINKVFYSKISLIVLIAFAIIYFIVVKGTQKAEAAIISNNVPMSYLSPSAGLISKYTSPGSNTVGNSSLGTPINSSFSEPMPPAGVIGFVRRAYAARLSYNVPLCATDIRLNIISGPTLSLRGFSASGSMGISPPGVDDWPELVAEISSDPDASSPLSVTLTDQLGGIGTSFNLGTVPWTNNNISVNRNDLADGIYFSMWIETMDQFNNQGLFGIGRQWSFNAVGTAPVMRVSFNDANCTNYDLYPSVSGIYDDQVNNEAVVNFTVTNNGTGPSIKSDGMGVTVTTLLTVNGGAPSSEIRNNQRINQGASNVLTFNRRLPLNIGDRICAQIIVSPASGETNGPDNGDTRSDGDLTNSVCFEVPNYPYFRIYGNDAMAGGFFADESSGNPTPCSGSSPADATFKGFNAAGDGGGNNTTNPSLYLRGAGSQHALFAMGTILSVASSANRNYNNDNTNLVSATSRYPTRQTFANSPSIPGFGGGSEMSRCIPDFYSRAPSTKTPNVYDLTIGNSTQTLHASPRSGELVNIRGVNVTTSGLRQTIFIDGDTKIADGANITYDNGLLDDVGEIPNLTIVVRGDLYIDNDTTRLDGTYIVQPRAGGVGGGRLITCYDSGYNGGAGRPFDNASLPSACNRKLEINGAVIAKEIILLRTNGHYKANLNAIPGSLVNGVELPGSSNIAEVFNFGPEIYLNPTNFTTSSSTGKYDAINVLPPVF